MKEVFRCPKCNSSQTRCRVKTNDRICYVCGHIWTLNLEEKADGDI